MTNEKEVLKNKQTLSDEKIDYIIKKMQEFRDHRVGDSTEVDEETMKLLADDFRNLCDEIESKTDKELFEEDSTYDEAYYNQKAEEMIEKMKEISKSKRECTDDEYDDAYYEKMGQELYEEMLRQENIKKNEMFDCDELINQDDTEEILLDEKDIAEFYAQIDLENANKCCDLSDATKTVIETGQYINVAVATGEGRKRLASLEMNKTTDPSEILEANKTVITLCYKYLLDNFDKTRAEGLVEELKQFLETINEEKLKEMIKLLS